MSRIVIGALESDQRPFSPAVRSGGVIYVSGQIGLDPATGKLVPGGVEAEVRQVFANLAAIVGQAGKSFDDVLRAGVYLTDMADYATVNALYVQHFNRPYPARTAIAVAAMPLGAAVEIDLLLAD